MSTQTKRHTQLSLSRSPLTHTPAPSISLSIWLRQNSPVSSCLVSSFVPHVFVWRQKCKRRCKRVYYWQFDQCCWFTAHKPPSAAGLTFWPGLSHLTKRRPPICILAVITALDAALWSVYLAIMCLLYTNRSDGHYWFEPLQDVGLTTKDNERSKP